MHITHGLRKDFFQGRTSRGFSQNFFQGGGQKQWNLFFTRRNWKNNLFLLILSKSRGALAPPASLPTPMRREVSSLQHFSKLIIEMVPCPIPASVSRSFRAVLPYRVHGSPSMNEIFPRVNENRGVNDEWMKFLFLIILLCGTCIYLVFLLNILQQSWIP